MKTDQRTSWSFQIQSQVPQISLSVASPPPEADAEPVEDDVQPLQMPVSVGIHSDELEDTGSHATVTYCPTYDPG